MGNAHPTGKIWLDSQDGIYNLKSAPDRRVTCSTDVNDYYVADIIAAKDNNSKPA